MKEKWMNIWKSFEEKHPKLSKWVYQIFYFFVFSMGVTVFQYLAGAGTRVDGVHVAAERNAYPGCRFYMESVGI